MGYKWEKYQTADRKTIYLVSCDFFDDVVSIIWDGVHPLVYLRGEPIPPSTVLTTIPPYTTCYGYLEVRRISNFMASIMMSGWRSKSAKSRNQEMLFARRQFDITRRVLSKLYSEIVADIESHIDPRYIILARNSFAVAGEMPDVLYNPRMLQMSELIVSDDYFINDVSRFRGAAAAVHYMTDRDYRLPAELQSWAIDGKKPHEVWRSFFSCAPEPYRALNVTLDNLPGGVPVSRLYYLQAVRLPRPLTTRASLSLVLGFTSAFEMISEDDDEWPIMDAFRCVFHASDSEIRKALEIAFRGWGHYRKSADILRLGQDIADFASHQHRQLDLESIPDNITLVGLARMSLEWHDGFYTPGEYVRLKPEDNVVFDAPPVLPDDPHITFISDALQLIEEGRRMQHCVATHIPNAINGHLYFHVDYEGDEATVQVNQFGEVVQSRGPRNTSNKATDYGQRVLSEYGKKIGSRASKKLHSTAVVV